MTLQFFDELLKANNAIGITPDIVVFNDYELYNHSTKEAKQYSNIFDLTDDNPDIKEIILNTETFYNPIDGGRGANSGVMGGGFGHAGGSGGGGGKTLLNAELNVDTNQRHSVNAILKRFQNKYGDADHEYGVSVDTLGYVHKHVEGGATSVSITGNKGEIIIHNHPSGGNFSDSDLLSVSRTQEAGIIATSSNTSKKATYRFEKTSHFKPKEFEKAVRQAKWPAHYSYDKGADWWLRKNAKTYGYKYSATGVPKT